MVRRQSLIALLVVAAACSNPLSVDGFRRIPIPNTGTGSLGGMVTQPDIEGNPAPFPGVSILLLSSPGPGAMAAILGRATTDSSGSWEFTGLAAGRYGLAVNAPSSPSFNGADMYGIQVEAGFKTIVNVAAGRPSF